MSRFNPSTLLFSAFLYSIFISFNKIEFIYFLPVIFLIYCEFKNIISIIKKLIFLNLFIIMIFLVLLFQNSVDEAINIYMRTNMIILFNLLLFSSSNGYDIIRALHELRFPNAFVCSIYFTLKMIQTLSDELKKIRFTLKARGFRARSTMFTYETFGNLFGHIFVKSIIKANAMQESFQLRGFNGKIYLINNSKLSIYDFILVFLVLLLYIKKVII